MKCAARESYLRTRGYVADDVGNIPSIIWTPQTSPADQAWRSILWNGSNYACVSATGAVTQKATTSANAAAWQLRTTPSAPNFLRLILCPGIGAGGADRLVACASAGTGTGNRIMVSDDKGATWVGKTTPASINTWVAMAFSPTLGTGKGRIVCANTQNAGTQGTMHSDDAGETWTLDTSPVNIWNVMEWVAPWGKFVCAGGGGTTAATRLMTSVDGINFVQGVMGPTAVWNSMAFAPELGRLVIGGQGGDINAYSDDGVTFKPATLSAGSQNSGICWSPKWRMFTAMLTTSGLVGYSQDGEVWARGAGANTNNWQGVCYSADRDEWCACAITGTGNRFMTGKVAA